ncbi:Imm72 family immunity protein [Paraburkholderia sp. MPAMCS5]|uniref:Imm72 family immunity protein n=1 Tax=Paraburkholderia sp. MPAMCS5 TaxID=3112563 RepID=UPI002E1770BF|nr:Imm72 family immunity protein [Paraburkholderia sp. MPAMCS5]
MSDFIYVAAKNDDAARDRAFYLLKKYTSATLMRRAIGLYREFLRDFEREIKRPEVKIDYSDDLIRFMRFLQPMEYAEPLLVNPARRPEAFRMLLDALDFDSYIWGRTYEELGAADPGNLFYKLGYRAKPQDSIGIFGKANLSGCLLSIMATTLSKESVLYLSNKEGARSIKRWTYESIFYDDLPSNAVPPIRFPAQPGTCPPRNEDNTGEVWTGRQIPVTGIWEPWAIDPKIGVRCPNYYLAGDTASQYQFEGTDTLEDVRWRLIWKDSRYASGQIPSEEDDYFAPDPSANLHAPIMRQARPGEVCPESGEWFAPHLNNQTFRMKAGEIMPGPQYTQMGSVIWYLKRRPQIPSQD